MASEFSDLIVVEKHHEEQQVSNEGTENSQRTHNETDTQELPTLPEVVPERRRLSIKSERFRVVAIVIFVVITAVVGGGVGGVLSHKDNNKTVGASSKNSATQASAATFLSSSSSNPPAGPISPPPTRVPPSLTTTEVDSSTTTLLRDCPSSNNTLYDVAYGGKPRLFRKICNLAFLNSNNNAIVSVRTTNLDDCIDQCAAYNMQEKDRIWTGESSVCNAVCWVNTFNSDWPGQCFGYATQNSTEGRFEVRTDNGVCDSAAWINQSFD